MGNEASYRAIWGTWFSTTVVSVKFVLSHIVRVVQCCLQNVIRMSEFVTLKQCLSLSLEEKANKRGAEAFVGALLLLGIHGVRNHRKVWISSKA